MIKLLGNGSSPRAGDPNAMCDSLSTVMLQDVLQAAREFSGECATEMIHLGRRISQGTLKTHNPLQGKVAGIVVAGSELGQDTVAKEIMLILNLYGFLLPPQALIYHTGHSMQ